MRDDPEILPRISRVPTDTSAKYHVFRISSMNSGICSFGDFDSRHILFHIAYSDGGFGNAKQFSNSNLDIMPMYFLI